MSWVAAAVTVGSAVAGGVAGKQKAPKKVPFKPVDAQEEQGKSIAGNLAQSDSIEGLVSRANDFSQDQATGLMEKAVPGYGKLSERLMGLAGEAASDPYGVPKGVEANVSRLAAERGISTGVRGQAQQYDMLRDFGVNSLEHGTARIGQAQSILSTIVGMSPKINPASPLSFYVSPGQQMDNARSNNTGKQNTDQAANNAKTAASNYNASMWGDIIANVGGIASGAMKPKADPSK